MNRPRYATKEEIESIQQKADLTETSTVLAWDTPQGPILKVVKYNVVEVDPAFYPEGCQDRFKLCAARDIETYLMAQGVKAYYFNVHETDEKWQNVVKGFGAESTSTAPERRFKKVL